VIVLADAIGAGSIVVSRVLYGRLAERKQQQVINYLVEEKSSSARADRLSPSGSTMISGVD
jgi:hypothetical protein